MKIAQILFGLAATVAMTIPAISAEPYGPFNLQSGKVYAVWTGKTAHRDQCYAAPNDRFFVPDSWKITMISAAGKNASCYFTNFETKAVEITLANGVKTTVPFMAKFCVAAHAETGSHTGGTTAWAECSISAQMEEHK